MIKLAQFIIYVAVANAVDPGIHEYLRPPQKKSF